MIKAGDKITFKREWQDEGDENFTFTAVNDEYEGRVLVEVDIPHFFLKPTQIIGTYMIQK